MNRCLLSAAVVAAQMVSMTGPCRSEPIDATTIYDAEKLAVVQIHAFGAGVGGTQKSIDSGTGVFISPNGYILTALHVIGRDDDWNRLPLDQLPDRRIEVIGLGAHGTPQVFAKNAAVVMSVPDADLALLRINGYDYSYADVATQRPTGLPPVLGIVWAPNSEVPGSFNGALTTTDVAANHDVLTIQMNVSDGYSGAPIFDASCRIIGIITQRLDAARAIAVPSTEISVSKYTPSNASSSGRTPTPEDRDSMQEFLALLNDIYTNLKGSSEHFDRAVSLITSIQIESSKGHGNEVNGNSEAGRRAIGDARIGVDAAQNDIIKIRELLSQMAPAGKEPVASLQLHVRELCQMH